MALKPLGVDNLIALFPLCNHLQDNLRRVLKIGINNNYRLPFSIVHPGGNRDLMAEIAGEVNQLDIRVTAADPAYNLSCAVTAAIIDEDQLVGITTFVHNLLETLIRMLNDFLLIVHRDNYTVSGFHPVSS
ncbi:hypothetical protein D3C80_1542550 [compost metagenome]